MEKVTVACGEKGNFVIKHYTVTEEEAKFENVRGVFSFSWRCGSRRVEPGTYTVMYDKRRGRSLGNSVIMSDTPAEMRDHSYFIYQAKGKVLVNGLGLGVVLHNLLLKDEVEHITVVEIEPDVIALVGPHYKTMGNGRLNIIQADALTYDPRKGVKFDAIWHDIWPAICEDNIPTMSTLHRRYGRRLTPAGFQDSWCRGAIKDMQRRNGDSIW